MDNKYITSTEKVFNDLTRTFDYSKLVQEELDELSNIEVTEDLKVGGVHDFEAWKSWALYVQENFFKTSIYKETIDFANTIDAPKILSLGCGHGGHELHIAKAIKKPFEMIGLDLNADLFGRAVNEAKANQLNIKFEACDLNFVNIEKNSFDIIFAHASLHHILNLEHLFHQVYYGLKENGRFIVLDIIGKTQVLFWKENVDFARKLVEMMPAKYKSEESTLDEILPPYVEPSIQKGMEGIRQEEIEFEISKYFTPIKMFKYASFVRMLCTNPLVLININPKVKEDTEYLESLFELDLRMVREKKLSPTEMFAVFQKKDILSIQGKSTSLLNTFTRFLPKFLRSN